MTAAARVPNIAAALTVTDLAHLDSAIDDWSGCEFRGHADDDLEWQRIELSGCRFVNAALTGVALPQARIVDTEFLDCELSGVDLSEASLHRVRFVGCRASGIDLSSTTLRDVVIDTSKFDDVNLRMAKLERVHFTDTVATRSDFTAAAGTEVALQRCELAEATFTKTKLRPLDIQGSTLDGIVAADALVGVTISSEQVLPFALALFAAHRVTVTE